MASYSYIFNICKLKDALYEVFANDDTGYELFIKDNYANDVGKQIVIHLLTFVNEGDSPDKMIASMNEELGKILDSYSVSDEGLFDKVEYAVRDCFKEVEDEFDTYDEYVESENAKEYKQYLKELKKHEIARTICIVRIEPDGSYNQVPFNVRPGDFNYKDTVISTNEKDAINQLIKNVAELSDHTKEEIKDYLDQGKFKIIDVDELTA